MSESFFSRWSRQKRASTPSQVIQAPPTDQTPAVPQAGEVPAATAKEHLAQPSADGTVTAKAPLPTLDDVQALTPASDFQPFMQRGVGAEVRNAAMKKLFADPHFNVMDGLDIYIDDYSRPDPMPAGMLGKMASAQFLKLVPEPGQEGAERPAQDPHAREEAGQVSELVAQSPDSSAMAEPPRHDDPDLQLQPDPASEDPASGPGPR